MSDTPQLPVELAKAIEPQPESITMAAYRELMTGPVPASELSFRRAVMLAVLIGRQIESDYRDKK